MHYLTLIHNYLLVLVSAGRSSGRMARHIQTSKKYNNYEKVYVFCNTGQERPESIQFLKDMIYNWDIPINLIEGVYSSEKGVGVKHKIVDFNNLSMNSEPFSQCIMQLNKHKWTGVPNQAIPYCSDYLKTRPSHSFAKDIFGTTKYIKALGFRKEDMPKRITLQELKEDRTRIAPNLTDFDHPLGQKDLNIFYKNEGFRLHLHGDLGNCKYCWKRDRNKTVKAIQYDIRLNDYSTVDWYIDMEKIYGNNFFRENTSIEELVKIAEMGTQIKMFPDQDDKCVCNF